MQGGAYRSRKKIWDRQEKRDEGQRTALTEPGTSARQAAMMLRRLHPLESAPRLEGGLVRDVIGGRPLGSAADFSPFSVRTSLLHCHLCLRLWHSDSGTPNLFLSDILSGIRGVGELRSSNTAILAGNSYAPFHLPDCAKQREVFPP